MLSMIEQKAFEAVAEIPRALRAIEQRLGGGPREGEAAAPPANNAGRFAGVEDALEAWRAETQGWEWADGETEYEDRLDQLAKDQVAEFAEWCFEKPKEAGNGR